MYETLIPFYASVSIACLLSTRWPWLTECVAGLVFLFPLVIPASEPAWRSMMGVSSVFYGLRVLELAAVVRKHRRLQRHCDCMPRHRSRSPSSWDSTSPGNDEDDNAISDNASAGSGDCNHDNREARLFGVWPTNAFRRLLVPFLYFHVRDLCLCWRGQELPVDGKRHSLWWELWRIGPRYAIYSLTLMSCIALLRVLPSVRPGSVDWWQGSPDVSASLSRHDISLLRNDTLWMVSRGSDWLLGTAPPTTATIPFNLIRVAVRDPAFLLAWLPAAKLMRYVAGMITLYLFLDAIDFGMKLIILPLAAHIPADITVQQCPILAESLNEFWSERWNRIIQEQILKRCIFRPLYECFKMALSKSVAANLASWFTFVFSGLWHALPIWYTFGTISHFNVQTMSIQSIPRDLNGDGSALDEPGRGFWLGWMMFSFFVVQSLGIAFERHFLLPQRLPKAWKHVWVCGFLAISLPLILEPVLQSCNL